MKTTTQIDDVWVLQVCDREFSLAGKSVAIWRTITRPTRRKIAMQRLRRRFNHQRPHRILTGVEEAIHLNSSLEEVQCE